MNIFNHFVQSLAEFTDEIGARVSGSESFEKAVDYMLVKLRKAGLDNVHTENAKVPHWVRGYESCEMLSPRKQKIKIAGIGSSVGTPRGGIIADLIVVETFNEFDKLKDDDVRGKIVLFAPKWRGYVETVGYRTEGASIASKKGAVAALVRSITPFSIGSLHVGGQNYSESVPKIPMAAVTVEDASMLLRMYRRGDKITMKLIMEDRNFGDAICRNTIAEIAGRSSQPVVVVSGHLDSWDLGVGAVDDGGGAFISWKALHLLKTIKVKPPRRTIRAILWTGEEQNYSGAREYMKAHKANEENEFNFFIESDTGTFQPLGLDFSGNQKAKCIFKQVLKLMAPLNATKFDSPVRAGPDIAMWTMRGFPGASLINKNENYFDFHHSEGDSMLVQDPVALDKNTALFAAAAYVIADLSVDMPKDIIYWVLTTDLILINK